MAHGYCEDALVRDPATDAWSLRADYDPRRHRIEVREEAAPGRMPSARACRPDGTLISAGTLERAAAFEVAAPAGGTIRIDRAIVAGRFVGYLASAPLQTGLRYPEAARAARPAPPAAATGLAAGTPLTTPRGDVPVEWLEPGTRVLTRDHGFQPVLWLGRSVPRPAGVRVAPGAVAPGVPDRPIHLAPDQGVLVTGADCALLFGEDEVLCPAAGLPGAPDVGSGPCPDAPVWHHVLLPVPDLVACAGAWTASFLPDAAGLSLLSPGDASDTLAVLGPGHRTVAARPVLHGWEAALLFGAAGRLRPRQAA